jgi:hypothetical protein
MNKIFIPLALLLLIFIENIHAQHAATYSDRNASIQKPDEEKGRWEGKYKRVKGSKPQRDGEFKFYNELDELVKIIVYENGIGVSTKRIPPKAFYYDKNNKLTELHRYDVNGYLSSSSPGIFAGIGAKDAIEKYIYDKNGNLIEERYYENKSLIKDEYTPSIIRYEYDSQNKLLKKSQLDHNGKLMDDIMGLSYTTYEYDKSGNLIKSQHYKKDGTFSDAEYGTSTVLRKYDDRNNLIEKKLLKPDGKLAGLDMAGAPIERFRYNEKNQMIHSEGWQSENILIGIFKKYYDDKGNEIKNAFYSGEDTTKLEDYEIFEYDSVGNKTTEKSIDPLGNIKYENKSMISLDIEGWEWIVKPSIYFDKDTYGNISFKFKIDQEGNIAGYALTDRAGSTNMMDFCINVLNNLKLKKTGGDFKLTGTIQFSKL